MIGKEQPHIIFDQKIISRTVPTASGTYAIFSGTKWIYVGESPNMLAALLEHLDGYTLCILQHRPTSFQFVKEPELQRVQHQARLVQEQRPVCNPKPS
jgi:hypothetical protein